MNSQYPWNQDKVLIVDDSKEQQQDIRKLYQEIGFQKFDFASDGLEALSKIKKTEDFNLISLDIIMPTMHGIECYEKIKEIKPDLKIVFISFLASDPNFLDSMKEKIPDEIMLGKPVSKGALLITLKNLYQIKEQEPASSKDDTPASSEGDTPASSEDDTKENPESQQS
jgi:two-component system, chemotaxis family, chemotaxis protein CheY